MIFGGARRGAPRKIPELFCLAKGGHVMKNIVLASWAAFLLSILAAADIALADDSFILATGRRDPRIYAIDFRAALKRHNNNTPNAIVSRSKVHPDRLDGTPVGDPANIVLSEDRRTAHACPRFPVPFVSPTPPPVVPFSAPDPQFGCWPNPEFLAVGRGSDGKTYLFSGNAGTNDVSVMDLHQALAGVPVVEVAPRVPVQTGPFGIKASPNGKFIAVTARESGQADFEGNTISIIDVDRARAGAPGAEAARVRVGTDDPNGQTRPFTVAWTPDGRQIIVANFRANNVSIVDLGLALKHDPHAEVARMPVVRPAETDGTVLPGRPKGTVVTSDGRYAVVSGGPRLAPTAPPSGTVWVIDLRTRAVVATVTGVGNDPYGLTILEDRPD